MIISILMSLYTWAQGGLSLNVQPLLSLTCSCGLNGEEVFLIAGVLFYLHYKGDEPHCPESNPCPFMLHIQLRGSSSIQRLRERDPSQQIILIQVISLSELVRESTQDSLNAFPAINSGIILLCPSKGFKAHFRASAQSSAARFVTPGCAN